VGEHPFTIINGALFLAEIADKRGGYFGEAAKIVLLGKPSTHSNLLPNRQIRNFGKYFDDLDLNIGNAVKTFFNRNGKVEKITDITGIPQIKLATTNYWIPVTEMSSDIMDVSTIAAQTHFINRRPFIYKKERRGAILLSSTTLLAPLEIRTDRTRLPHLIPLSIGQKIHYIDTIVLPDGTDIEEFFKQSLEPFSSEMKYLHYSFKKTLVINKVAVGKKIYQAVVFAGYAFYIETSEHLIASKTTPSLSDLPLKMISLEESPIPKNLKKTKSLFLKKLSEGQDQATKEAEFLKIKRKAWEISIKRILYRQSLFNVLATITSKKLDWAIITDESEAKIIKRIVNEIKKEMFDSELLMNLSDDELTILENIAEKVASKDTA